MILVAIRHLRTPWNRGGLLQGRADIPIDPPDSVQRKKIQEIRRKLDRFEPFDLVVSSTLSRTRQTAVAYGFKRPVREPLLDEFDFGICEGTKKALLAKKLGAAWIKQPHTIKLGESVRNFEQRINKFLRKYRRRNRILLFGHGCWLRALKSIHKVGDVRQMNLTTIRNDQLLILRF